MPRGEIVVGDNSVTAGYFNNQAKTDDVYKRNGAEQAGVKYSDFSELCENGDAVNKVQQPLTKAAKVEKFEIPAKIKLLPEPFLSKSLPPRKIKNLPTILSRIYKSVIKKQVVHKKISRYIRK
ncbi:unnamed protein product [Brassica oleracea]